jgi:DNA-binding GntR family transcriptional regulator
MILGEEDMKNLERAEAYGGLRSNILSGEWIPGDIRTEHEIAELQQNPRQAVREALAVLEATGLVGQVPGLGVQVRQYTVEDAQRSLRLRIDMEAEIADECARVRKPVSNELYSSLGDMATALRNGKQIEFMLADTRFHVGLTNYGGFSGSRTALEGMRDIIHLYRLHNECLPTKPQMLAALGEHATVLTMVESGDPQLAREAMYQHLNATYARLQD